MLSYYLNSFYLKEKIKLAKNTSTKKTVWSLIYPDKGG